MKKTVLFFVLSCVAAWPAYATTDQKTMDFLETVNAQYYCLSRLGLKNFSADVSFTTVRDTEYELKEPLSDYLDEFDTLTFEVSVGPNGSLNVAFKPSAQNNGGRDIDKASFKLGEQMASNLSVYLENWSCFMLYPVYFFNHKKDSNSFTFQNTADGFTVLRTNKNYTGSSKYDSQSKLLNYTQWSGNNSTVSDYNFSKTNQGYLLNETTTTDRTLQTLSKYEYQTVGNYLLPGKIRSRLNMTGFLPNGIGYYFTFSNYKINQ